MERGRITGTKKYQVSCCNKETEVSLGEKSGCDVTYYNRVS